MRQFVKVDLKVIIKMISASSNTTQIQPISDVNFEKYITRIYAFMTGVNPNQEKVARICWNSKNWQSPSGKYGKSKSKDAYENDMGFGHEEWLFDPSRSINGYHFSYLQQINTKNNIHNGNKYTIHLFTLSTHGKKYYVGRIDNVICIDGKECKNIKAIYQKNGWFKSMAKEVDMALGYNATSRFKINFNIKYKLTDVHIEDSLIEISDTDPNTRSRHYVLMNKISDFTFNLEEDDSGIQGTSNLKKTSTRKRTICADIEFDPLHDRMQNEVVAILKSDNNYNSDKIYTEHNRVDIKAITSNGKLHFFELKTSSAKSSIRQALGQLLEYNHYPNKCRADKLFIVSHSAPTKDDIEYISSIRSMYKINVWYKYFDFNSKTLSKEY